MHFDQRHCAPSFVLCLMTVFVFVFFHSCHLLLWGCDGLMHDVMFCIHSNCHFSDHHQRHQNCVDSTTHQVLHATDVAGSGVSPCALDIAQGALHTHMDARAACACTHTHTHTHACMHAHTHTHDPWLHVLPHIYIEREIDIYIDRYMCVHSCMYTQTFDHSCMHTHTHTRP